MMRKLLFLCTLLLLFLFGNDELTINDVRNLSINDLLQIKIVTAAKNSQNVSDIPASVVVITREEISKLGYRSYPEILDHVTGFYMIDDYHYLGHKNFSVRGFFSPGSFGNVIVLVNGVPQLSDEYMDYPDTKITVPVEAIDRIEIIRGPMSVIYGNGAFFGAINIITNNDYKVDQVSVSYSDKNEKSISYIVSGEENELKYKINGGMTESPGINVKFSELTSNLNLIEYAGLRSDATTNNKLESNKKYVDISINHNSLFAIISYNESVNEILDGLPSFGEGSEITHFSTNLSFGLDKKLTDRIKIKGQIGYYLHSHLLDYERRYIHTFDLDSKKSRAYDFDFTTNIKASEKIDILMGTYFRNVIELMQIADFPSDGLSRGDGEIMIPRDEVISTKSVYSQITFKPCKKIDIIGGFRIEHLSPYSINYSRGVVTYDTTLALPPESRVNIQGKVKPKNDGYSLTPRFAMIYKMDRNNIIKLLYGTAITQPTFMNNLRQIIMQRPFLNVQKIKTWEINYLTSINKKIQANFSLFFNDLTDLITSTNEFSTETGWNIYSANSGQLQTVGFEATGKFEINNNFLTNISFIVQKTQNKKEGFEDYTVGYSPELMINGYLSYKIHDNLNLSLMGKYIDDIETAWYTDMNPEDGYRIGEKIDAYFLWDANLRYSNPYNLPIELNVNVKNIFNYEVRYPTTFSNDWVDKGYLGLGRSLFFSLTYQLIKRTDIIYEKKNINIILIFCLSLMTIHAHEAEYIVKSAFIEKFCRFTEWPEEKMNASKEFKIVVLGKSNFTGILEKVFNEIQLKKKPVSIEYCKNLDDIKTVPHVIIISENRSRNIDEIIKYATENSILTIGDTDGFCKRGVHINFYLTEDETLHFTINLESVKKANLRISLMLIEIAKII